MDPLIGTIALRPYVFAFVALFVVAGLADLGWRRTTLFGGWVWCIAWLAEFSSTRTGLPFGLYHYTGLTHGQELYLANVPLMDSLSFTFLAYAAFALARIAGRARARPLAPSTLALLSGVLMMLLDVVVDPLAVRGDRWFLGRIFYYPAGGSYFGVPLTNFVGWVIVGTVGVGGYLALAARVPRPGAAGACAGAAGRRAWPGAALYYVVLTFNLAMTGWIGEWLLLVVGVALHLTVGLWLWSVCRLPGVAPGLETQSA
jgi:uncharacterized membrane protein